MATFHAGVPEVPAKLAVRAVQNTLNTTAAVVQAPRRMRAAVVFMIADDTGGYRQSGIGRSMVHPTESRRNVDHSAEEMRDALGVNYRYSISPKGKHMSSAQNPEPEQKNWFLRHKIISAIGVLIVIGVAVNLGGGSNDSSAPAAAPVSAEPASGVPAEAPQSTTEQAASAPGIGTPVRDGKFEFTVANVQTGVPSVGPDMLEQTAQGQYVLVTLNVRNIGDKAQSFSTSSQKLLDANGTEYSSDDLATIYLDQGVGYEQINPGNALDVTVVFDVPVAIDPTEIELHDSIFSGGETVSLR